MRRMTPVFCPLPDLEGTNLIMNEALRAVLQQNFKHLTERSHLSMRNVSSLVAMVVADMGVTLLPNLATLNLPADVTCRALADASCCRTVGIIQRSEPLGKSLSSHLRSFCPQTGQSRYA